MFKVFVGSSGEGRPVAEAVADLLNTHPLIQVRAWWDPDVAIAGRSFLDALFEVLDEVDFGVFVATPDDLLLRRGLKQLTVRDNVLLEYGMFAGRLGRRSAILFQIGDTALPSDLEGITVVKAGTVSPEAGSAVVREVLREPTDRCVDQLLLSSRDKMSTAMEELRLGYDLFPPGDVRALLARAVHQRLDPGRVRLGITTLRSILNKYDRGQTIVGSEEHPSTVSAYFDLATMAQEDLQTLAAAYTAFSARHLSNGSDPTACPTRIAFHYKVDPMREYERDLRFLAEVAHRLGIRPAMVDLEATSESSRIKGRWVHGEEVVLLQDFTSRGFTPMDCVDQLRRHGVGVSKLLTFMVHEEHLREVEENCGGNDVEFHPFCVRTVAGDLEILAV